MAIIIKTTEEIEKMRELGRLAAEALELNQIGRASCRERV